MPNLNRHIFQGYTQTVWISEVIRTKENYHRHPNAESNAPGVRLKDLFKPYL